MNTKNETPAGDEAMPAMQRYDPEIYNEDRIRMEESGDGEYIKYSDTLAVLVAKNAEIAHQRNVNALLAETGEQLRKDAAEAWVARDEMRAERDKLATQVEALRKDAPGFGLGEQIDALNRMRLALVGQIHELSDVAERAASRMRQHGDMDECKYIEGAIAYAKKVVEPHGYNGPLKVDVPQPPSVQSAPGAAPAGDATVGAGIYVAAHECHDCGHKGINDSHKSRSACNRCDWTGDSPAKDKCPQCGCDGTMTSACPECECRYMLVTDATLPSAPGQTTRAAQDVLAERQRQINKEGWTPEHDDEHDNGELVSAAVCYSLAHTWPKGMLPVGWPWAAEWWKTKDRRSNLVRANALLLAEIERLDRVELAKAVKP